MHWSANRLARDSLSHLGQHALCRRSRLSRSCRHLLHATQRSRCILQKHATLSFGHVSMSLLQSLGLGRCLHTRHMCSTHRLHRRRLLLRRRRGFLLGRRRRRRLFQYRCHLLQPATRRHNQLPCGVIKRTGESFSPFQQIPNRKYLTHTGGGRQASALPLALSVPPSALSVRLVALSALLWAAPVAALLASHHQGAARQGATHWTSDLQGAGPGTLPPRPAADAGAHGW